MKLFGYEITIKRVEGISKPSISKVVHVQPDKPWPRQSTFAIVQMSIHRECGNSLDEIKPESTLWDLMLDGLDWTEVLMAVEDAFDIDINMHDWECCRNVKEACDLIEKVLEEK